MTALETIDRLCAVAAQQAEIIREQAIIIEQMNTRDEETKNHFSEKRISMEKEFDLIKSRALFLPRRSERRGKLN